MTKEKLQTYTARITQASKTELIVIMYEIILNDMEEAKTAYQDCDKVTYDKDLKHASTLINELMRSLNYRYEISFQLISLYIYVNKCLITARFQKKPELLTTADSVIRKLMAGYCEICKEDLSGPVMQNTQQLYAGLTYGRGVLNEVYIDPNEHIRGFKA